MAMTIFALSSGRPPAAVSVIRVSGSSAHLAASQLAGSLPEPRTAAVRDLRSLATGEVIDRALIIRFDSPASVTGEDVVEFQCHGGRAVSDAVLRELAAIDGLRAAQPGEFTRRAFENGRIDLTEAEGLADLIEAETDSQRRAAIALAEGGLKKQIGAWQERLLALAAEAERAIDYSDDEDATALNRECGALADELESWLERPRVEPLKEGVRVVIAGFPNVGKSSLLNSLSGSTRAIVTDLPGTTRDHIDVPMSVGGIPVLLTDTAGLRDADEPVEAIGVGRAKELAQDADILIWLGEGASVIDHPRLIAIHPKSDLPGRETAPAGTLAVSSTTMEGIQALLERIVECARAILPREGALAFNRRQATLVEEAAAALTGAAGATDIVIIAEELRHARSAFDRVTGRAGVEEVLDALFSRFCLGK